MTSYKKKEEPKKDFPDIIKDPNTGQDYIRGKFLGKGGFARCYELTNSATKQIFAGKIVSKSLLKKQHQKDKMCQEISIHRSLKHSNIVTFHTFFEDSENVYIVLELCRRRSLMELHKRRREITEPETRYFMRQLLLGVKYLHDHSVIHRDLKLGNLFLNDEMEIKIGDFGLATRVDYEGERKRTLCGTPNYIAPEILCKRGHSYKVDVWSIGCILFTMLAGKPPFETDSLKETYSRIKDNKYCIPSRIGPHARSLIQRLLQGDPVRRPTIDQILEDDFMTTGFLPVRLPTSCLTMRPRFDAHHMNGSAAASRKPLLEINTKDGSPVKLGSKEFGKRLGTGNENAKLPPQTENQGALVSSLKKGGEEVPNTQAPTRPEEPEDCHLRDLYTQVNDLVSANPDELREINEDEAEDPSAVPMIWVSKWVDYTDKYGLGYQLSDDSIGVLFNDFTKLLLLPDGENIHYIERSGQEHYHQLNDHPDSLHKKVTLLRYFRNYMNEHLLKAGAKMVRQREGDELARIPSLKTHCRTRSAIVLLLTNGTLQINFFEDHTKIILCPLMGAVTYIDKKRNFRTFRLEMLKKFGCSNDLGNRLRYARNMIQKLLLLKSGSSIKLGSAGLVAFPQPSPHSKQVT